MRAVLVAIRRLAVVAVILSVLAVPLGALLLFSVSASDGGGNALGELIAFGLGVGLVGLGIAGLILGSALAVLAKRSLAVPAEIRGSRRTVLGVGLVFAGGQLLISIALGGAFSFFVGLSAAFAAAYLVVAVASRRRGDLALSTILAVALLGVGLVPFWGQLSLNDAATRLADRNALLPADMDVAIDAAAAAAPDGWAVAALAAKGTNIGASNSRDVPRMLIARPLRGLVVIDCAGPGVLEVVTMDELSATVVVGSVPCLPEPQVMTFEIPGVTDYARPPAFVERISVDPVPNDGSIDGFNRAVILVALTETPDPDRETLIATFVAAYGAERPR